MSGTQRIEKLAGHLSVNECSVTRQSGAFGYPNTQSPNDVVIVSALRTPIARARKGAFKDTSPDDLLKAALEGVMAETKMNPEVLGDCVIGNVQLSGAYALPARCAQLRAGLPYTVPLRTVNRQCSSGLQAVATVASEIASGFIDAGIGGGVESMTNGGNPGDPSSLPPMNLNEIFSDPVAAQCLTAMGMTSETVAERYGITREQQDTMAAASHAKALKAQADGIFNDEIVPVTVTVEDKEGNESEVTVKADEGPREGTTVEKLAKLRAVFKKDGSTTAGNASQVSDGAAAVVMMKRSKAKELGLNVLGVFRGFKCVGVKPDEMGIGPAVAIPALLQDCDLPIDKVDVFELNEAFASQATYCCQKLNIPMEKVNPLGGAIALGHPLGCTGARQVATLLHQMKRTKEQFGVVSMCIGTGMGAAALFEAEN